MRNLIVLITFLLAACGDNTEPDPEVDAALPLCADVGCPSVAFCSADGVCSCLATGTAVVCRRQ